MMQWVRMPASFRRLLRSSPTRAPSAADSSSRNRNSRLSYMVRVASGTYCVNPVSIRYLLSAAGQAEWAPRVMDYHYITAAADCKFYIRFALILLSIYIKFSHFNRKRYQRFVECVKFASNRCGWCLCIVDKCGRGDYNTSIRSSDSLRLNNL